MKYHRLHVTVTDHLEQPLQGAVVYQNGVEPQETRRTTDDNGDAFLDLSKKGKRSIHVEKEGFKPFNRIFYDNGDVIHVVLQPYYEVYHAKKQQENKITNDNKTPVKTEANKVLQPEIKLQKSKRGVLDDINWPFVIVLLIVIGIAGFLAYKIFKALNTPKTLGIQDDITKRITDSPKLDNPVVQSDVTPVNTGNTSMFPEIINV